MAKLEHRNLNDTPEIKEFEFGRVQIAKHGGVTFGRATLQPGWKWSKSVKPLAKTASCQASHLQYQVSGRLHVVMDDGTAAEFVAGDVAQIPPGHDAWVVGNEPVVIIDVSGMVDYAKPASPHAGRSQFTD